MSGFPKILWNADVAAGLTWAWNDGVARSVALTDTTHDTILELAAHLQARINTIDAAATVTISQVGIVAVTIPSIVALNWGGTSNSLSAILGYTEGEALVGTAVTSTYQHLRGYYPGCMSYGWNAARGAGLTSPLCWEPDYHEVRAVAGNLRTLAVGPATPRETVELACSPIKCDSRPGGTDEWNDTSRGVRAWLNAVVTSNPMFRLYPDRAQGIVGTPGTVGTDYYNVALASKLKRRSAQHPSFCSWSVTINRETSP